MDVTARSSSSELRGMAAWGEGKDATGMLPPPRRCVEGALPRGADRGTFRSSIPFPETTMRHPLVRLATLALVSSLSARALVAQQPAQQPARPPETPLRIAASSYATVEVHLNARRIGQRWYEEDASLSGPSRIAISYGQPHARGRRVEGGLIPLDTVWRFGANMATALHSDVDITLGDLKLPRGDYSLFVLYSRSGWQLIVNRGTAMWGTDYDRTKDVGRIALTARTTAEPTESMTIYLVPDSPRPAEGYAELRGTLKIRWGTTELATTWRLDQ